MNIYLQIEIAARELDSKLLLAVIAAANGHDVLIGERTIINTGLVNGSLLPGILYKKDITPLRGAESLNTAIKSRGSLITCTDEEATLIDYNYDWVARARFSDETLDQAAAVFGWGESDTETLKQIYPRHADKIHLTGAPRVDMWTTKFSNYWGKPACLPERPYLLISSNMNIANNMRPFHESIRYERDAGGYYEREPELFSRKFGMAAENYQMIYAFIEAIRYMGENADGFDIVLRPHPVENIDAWNVFLKDIPNVHVIREGSITAWVNHAFAIMHNGCTTAVEATVSGKPVITYLPFEQKYARQLANDIGIRAHTPSELFQRVCEFFESKARAVEQPGLTISLPGIVARKIYIDKNRLGAQKIVDLWEEIGHDLPSQSPDWSKFKRTLRYEWLKGIFGRLARRFFPGRFEVLKNNYKFPPLDRGEIEGKVEKLQQILDPDGKVTCELLSNRAVLIRPFRKQG